MLLFLLACRLPEGSTATDSADAPAAVEDSSCGDVPADVNIDAAYACHDGDQVLVESGYDGPATHFEWTVDACLVAAGGSIWDVDAPNVEVQCPSCREPGTERFDIQIAFSDDEGRGLGYAYGWFAWVCPDE